MNAMYACFLIGNLWLVGSQFANSERRAKAMGRIGLIWMCLGILTSVGGFMK